MLRVLLRETSRIKALKKIKFLIELKLLCSFYFPCYNSGVVRLEMKNSFRLL